MLGKGAGYAVAPDPRASGGVRACACSSAEHGRMTLLMMCGLIDDGRLPATCRSP